MKDDGLDIIITYGNEAEPQYVRYFADFWPSFESAGVLVPAEGEPLLIIGPECQTYAEDRSRIKRIEKMIEFRESSEPEYPDIKPTKFSDLFAEFLDNSSNKKIGIVGYPIMPAPIYKAIKDEDISEVIKYIQEAVAEEITEHFKHVMHSKDYGVDDVPSARKHINAYLHLTLYSHHLYHFIKNPVLHEKDEH